VQSQYGSVHSKQTKLLGNNFELDLERRHLITILVELSSDLSVATVLSNDKAKEPAFSRSDLGSRKKHRRGNVVGIRYLVSEIGHLLVLLTHTDVKRLFFEIIRLTS